FWAGDRLFRHFFPNMLRTVPISSSAILWESVRETLNCGFQTGLAHFRSPKFLEGGRILVRIILNGDSIDLETDMQLDLAFSLQNAITKSPHLMLPGSGWSSTMLKLTQLLRRDRRSQEPGAGVEVYLAPQSVICLARKAGQGCMCHPNAPPG